MRTMTIEKICILASDGEWKSIDDLRRVTRYPEAWIKELRYDDFEVREEAGVFRLAADRARPLVTSADSN